MIESQNLKIGGAVVFWSVGEHTDRNILLSGWTRQGMEKYIPDPRPAMGALKDALGQVYPGSDKLIRPLKEKDGFVVKLEERGKDDNSYSTIVTVKVDPKTIGEAPEIFFVPFNGQSQDVVDAFNKHLGFLRGAQVGGSLVNILDYLGGCRLRPSGAVYWLPEKSVALWRDLAESVELAAAQGCSNKVYLIRSVMDQDAIKAVRDAIIAEITTEAARIEAEINGGELGSRALENRKEEAAALRSKIADYEGLLGQGLGDLLKLAETAELSAASASLRLAAGPEALSA